MNNDIDFKKSTVKKLNIMEKVALFFEEKNERILFTGLEKIPMLIDGWFVAKDMHKNCEETLQVYNDLEDRKRIRCKGADFAFSINQDELGYYYLDHLMLGDITTDNLHLTMRRTKELIPNGENLQEENTFTVKRRQKDGQHIIHVEDDSIDIVILNQEEQITKQMHFQQTDAGIIEMDDTSEEDKEVAWNEFLQLEKTYPMITGYINQWMPIVNKVIQFCREKQTKPYEIKRKKADTQVRKTYQKTPAQIIPLSTEGKSQ